MQAFVESENCLRRLETTAHLTKIDLKMFPSISVNKLPDLFVLEAKSYAEHECVNTSLQGDPLTYIIDMPTGGNTKTQLFLLNFSLNCWSDLSCLPFIS